MKIYIFLIIVIIGFSNCSKFLDEEPYTFLSPENLASSEEGVKMMITGMYSNLYTTYMMKKTYMEWLAYDNDWVNGEDWVMAGPGAGNVTAHWAYNGQSDLFSVFYTLIRNANIIIATINDVSTEQAITNQYLGEAYTMRAWCYLQLVQIYGRVPLRLATSEPIDMARSSIKEVYGRITEDLHKAESLLSLKSDGLVNYGHITKGAAQGLLARAYATMGSGALEAKSMSVNLYAFYDGDEDAVQKTSETFTKSKVEGYDFDPTIVYDSAKAVASRLIESNEYALENWATMWFPAHHGGDEFIWAVVGSSADIRYRTEHLNTYFSPTGLQGTGWIPYVPDLYYLYDKEDHRAKYGICHVYSRYAYDDKYCYFPLEDSAVYRGIYGEDEVVPGYAEECYLMKYYLGEMEDPTIVKYEDDVRTLNSLQDFPLVRYSEAYLLYAEAENELNGPTADVFDKLDVLRTARNAPLVDRNLNQDQLRSFIFEERLLEFVGEGVRRLDLLRWGVYLQVMNHIKTRNHKNNGIVNKTREPKNLLFPIPLTEVTSNKLFGPNNPGW